MQRIATTGFLGLAVLATISGRASANTYHVQSDGTDSGGGPWKTITYALTRLDAGDTLIIRAGTYSNEQATLANTGTPSGPITIRAEVSDGSVMMVGPSASEPGSGVGIALHGKSNVVIQGIYFTAYAVGIAVAGNGTSSITIRDCIFEDNHSTGIDINDTNADTLDCHNIEVSGNQFIDNTDFQDYGVKTYFCDDVRILHNYFFGDHHQACSFKEIASNSLVAYNVFEGFLYTALYFGQNLDANVGYPARSYNLTAEYNAFRPALGHRGKTPIWIANCTGATVRYNLLEGKSDVDGGWGQGIAFGDTDTMPEDVNVYGNVFSGIGGTTNNPAFRFYHDVRNVKIYNNTIANCAKAFGFEAYAEVLFTNNIFYNISSMIYEGDARNCTFENNDFFPDWSEHGSDAISADPVFMADPGEIVLSGRSPVFTPDFSRMEAYRLQSTSPCIDRGTDIGLPFAGSAPDLGAYEYGVPSTVDAGNAPTADGGAPTVDISTDGGCGCTADGSKSHSPPGLVMMIVGMLVAFARRRRQIRPRARRPPE